MHARKTITFGTAALLFSPSFAAPRDPARNGAKLGAEQVRVYAAFVDKLAAPLHIKRLAKTTMPFDFNGIPEGRPCLRGIELQDVSQALRATHSFTPEFARAMSLNLIENDTLYQEKEPGSLLLSEVVFDTKHRFAVMKYVLVCGQHCDSSATLVVEKISGRWTLGQHLVCAASFNTLNE